MKQLCLAFMVFLVIGFVNVSCADGGDSSSDTDTDSDTDADTDTDTDTDTDADSDTDTDTDSDTDDGEFRIETTELPYGQELLDYDEALETANAEGDVTWTLESGEMPPGLTFNDDGTITGVPEGPGEYPFTVMAEDDNSSDEADLTIVVPEILLMSGYGPFQSVTENPSYYSLLPLHEQVVNGFDIRVIELLVTWADAWVTLLAEIERLTPEAVIATGVAGTDYMRLETTGKNIMVGVDADGVNGGNAEIVKGGPATISDGLPLKEMAAAMNDAGYTANISNDAGDYLCNFALYNLMYYIENDATYDIVGGFIHVPPVPTANFELEDITEAQKAGILALREWMDSDKEWTPAEATITTAPTYPF